MAKIITSEQRVAAMAARTIANLKQTEIDAEAEYQRKERQRSALVAKLEIAMRDVCKAKEKADLARGELALVVGEDSARTFVQLVESKVDLDYGIGARIL